MTSGISERAAKWLEDRKLCVDTAARLGVRSQGPAIAFPYAKDGRELYAKLRPTDGTKTMRCSPAGVDQTVLWLEDTLKDAEDQQPDEMLIITEGEPDAIAFAQASQRYVVSMPSGAAATAEGCKAKAERALTVADGSGKPMLKPDVARFKRVLVATDCDHDGLLLRQAIVEVIGEEYCWLPTYPAGTKDANDVLQVGGLDAVARLVSASVPVKSDGFLPFPDAEPKKATKVLSFGMHWLEPHMKLIQPEFIVVGGQAGHGKALALDTPIPTPTGWATMGDLAAGDLVYDELGVPCRVVAATEVMTGRPCFEVEFATGEKIIADANHQWLTETVLDRQSREAAARPKMGGPLSRDQSTARRRPTIKTTAEIAGTLTYGRGGKVNHSIPQAGPVFGAIRWGGVDPYLLGVWLGDGHSNGNRITAQNDDALHYGAAAIAAGHDVRVVPVTDTAVNISIDPRRAGRNGVSFGRTLIALGLMGGKRIPEALLRADVRDRLALLRGLMDTDGSVRASDRVCEFTSTSEVLARGAFDLVAGLGLKPTWLEGDATLNGRVVSRKFRVCFTADVPVFSLARKVAVQMGGRQRRNIGHRIVGCRPVQSVPVRCIQVDSPSRLYLASRSYIPTHNSTVSQILLLNLLAQNPGLRASIFHGEGDRAIPIQRAKRFLRYRMFGGSCTTPDQQAKRDFWLRERLAYIAPPQDQLPTFDWMLWAMEQQALYRRRNVFMIDPWNEIVHQRPKGLSTTEYVGECIVKLKRLADRLGLILIVTHHVTKPQDVKRAPSRYDLADSAHWANKADHVLLVWKPHEDENRTQLEVEKSKDHDTMGRPGRVWVSLNNERFELLPVSNASEPAAEEDAA